MNGLLVDLAWIGALISLVGMLCFFVGVLMGASAAAEPRKRPTVRGPYEGGRPSGQRPPRD